MPTPWYRRMGAQLGTGGRGASFSVWAPNAREVSVIGEWNGWQASADRLSPSPDGSGRWLGAAAAARRGQTYKYRVVQADGRAVDKSDPCALYGEPPPATASRLWSLEHDWGDAAWIKSRGARNALDAPLSIYEVHAGSWRREDGGFLGYRELAHALADYLARMHFTHVELMPLTEHPFYGSWGYQTTGYFSPSARYGSPQDLMYLVDHLHQAGIGVILDWVPSHFPCDEHGLHRFDGTHLYEHADPRQGFHPEWNSSIFNYGRHEVSEFLVGSALFWLDAYHLDGLRVDGVASMLYLDYAREPGEWIPNRDGGHENLEAVAFLRGLNEAVYRDHPDVMTIAEESTAWPQVSRPTYTGGLGFGLKWNMGWMHDSLAYLREDPLYRKHHQGRLTFSLVYAFNENFVLPLSHDEVVYGKGSLVAKMPGDAWQRLANLRALFGYMWGHPGKKLLFMGGEFAATREWTHEGQLDWGEAELPAHRGVQRLVADLNRVYCQEPALHTQDFEPAGFEWLQAHDAEASVIAFVRHARGARPDDGGAQPLVVVCNFTPEPRRNYVLGVPQAGCWRELINTDARDYGGAGWGNLGGLESAPLPAHGRAQSLCLTLPPLSTLMFKLEPPPHDARPAAAPRSP